MALSCRVKIERKNTYFLNPPSVHFTFVDVNFPIIIENLSDLTCGFWKNCSRIFDQMLVVRK